MGRSSRFPAILHRSQHCWWSHGASENSWAFCGSQVSLLWPEKQNTTWLLCGGALTLYLPLYALHNKLSSVNCREVALRRCHFWTQAWALFRLPSLHDSAEHVPDSRKCGWVYNRLTSLSACKQELRHSQSESSGRHMQGPMVFWRWCPKAHGTALFWEVSGSSYSCAQFTHLCIIIKEDSGMGAFRFRSCKKPRHEEVSVPQAFARPRQSV